MTSSLRSYRNQSGGNVSAIFAMAAIPLLLAAGTAIDYLRYANVKADIQSALDGAALAAALPADRTDVQRVVIAKSYFASNLAEYGTDVPELDVEVFEDTILASVDTVVPTSFMKLGGIDTMPIHELSEVMRPYAGSAEVVLVLDYSGSMNSKNKYQDMETAATAMINNLDAAIADDKLKIGLVPFSAMVRTSMSSSYVNQVSATSTWTGCTQDRAYPSNTTVDTPIITNGATKWGYIDNNGENNGNYSCPNYQKKNLEIVPLTSDLAGVKSKLAAMRPLGNTNIPLGAEFGWNLLDPQTPFDEGQSYGAKTNRKFLILLTDGVQTSGQFGSGNSRSVSNGNQNLLTLCAGMRNAGITVFAIAYDINDPAVTTLLSSCAPGRYFEPDAGGSEISQVFSQITKQIKNKTARLSK